jgi:hypothetical protein
MFKRFFVLMGLLWVVLVVAHVVLGQEAHETPVTVIELTGPASEPDAELSGLAWHGDYLILMPENPNMYATEGNAGMLYALNKDDILAYVSSKESGQTPAPLAPFAIPVVGPDIAETVPGFDGFEAVTFADDDVYMVIESETDTEAMRGYLVKGSVEGTQPGLQITLDLENLVEIPGQTEWENMSYESLFVDGDQVVVVYEANGDEANGGVVVNQNPRAMVFNQNLEPVGEIGFAPVDYRLTDVTNLDDNGQFWAINYFFPGEDFLNADDDPIADEYGKGPTHSQFPQIERLIALQHRETGITLVDVAPIQLELLGEDARNLEGIARLDDLGLLVATDQYPETILGFVSFPAE